MSINIKRSATIIMPDQSRVLLRPFNPGDTERAGRIFARIMTLPEDRVGALVDEVSAEFSRRHQNIRKIFLNRFEQLRELLSLDEEVSEQRRLLAQLLFPGRIFLGIGRAVQPFHGPASLPERRAARRFAFRD